MTLRLQTRYYSENAILTDFRLQTLHYSIYRDLPTSDFLDTILFLLRLQTKSTLVRYVLSPAKESCSDLCNGPKFKIWMLDLLYFLRTTMCEPLDLAYCSWLYYYN